MVSGYLYSLVTHSWHIKKSIIFETTARVPIRIQTTFSHKKLNGLSVQFSSVTQSCPTLCDPMNCSIPGLLVHHQLPEFTQTLFHWVSDAINHLILCRPLLLLPSIFILVVAYIITYSFSLLNNFPLYGHTMFCLSIHQLVTIGVVSIFLFL